MFRKVLVSVLWIVLLATLARASFELGRFHATIAEPWRQALRTRDARECYEVLRQLWFARQRFNLSVDSPDFDRAVDECYARSIRVSADLDSNGVDAAEGTKQLMEFQRRYHDAVVPAGAAWLIRTHAVEFMPLALLLALSMIDRGLRRKYRSSRFTRRRNYQ